MVSTEGRDPYDICGQQRPWSDCAFAQSDQGLRFPAYIFLYFRICHWAGKVLIRLCGCAGWCASLLSAHGVMVLFFRCALNDIWDRRWKLHAMTHANIEDPDQPAHPNSLIRTSPCGQWVSTYFKCCLRTEQCHTPDCALPQAVFFTTGHKGGFLISRLEWYLKDRWRRP